MSIKNVFRNSSIFTKISILTSVLIILISVVSTSLLATTYTNEIQSRDRLLIQERAYKLNTFFEDCYNNMYNQRTFIHSPGNIADILAETRNDSSSLYELETLHKITDYLAALTYSSSGIEDTILFTSDGKNALSYSSSNSRIVSLGYKFNELPYIEEFRDSSASITVAYDGAPPYLTKTSSRFRKPVISFIMKIYPKLGANTDSPLGYIMMSYSLDSINEAYHDIDKVSDGNYIVLNNQSMIIYSNDETLLGKTYEPEAENSPEILYSKTIGLSGIKIIASLSNEKLINTTIHIIFNTLIIVGSGVLFMIVVIFLLHRHFAKKFQNLTTAMGNIGSGDFSVHLPDNSKDEIGYLNNAINKMSQALNEHIEKTYLAETKRRTAELYALQAQINPHFLANTIESIRMCAVENCDYESARMLKELGNLFRWMVQFDQDIIYLENEIEYARSYLDLMKFRFSDQLTVDLDTPFPIYTLGIPRFTLQPILENALSLISHKPQGMTVSIRFSVEKSILTVCVSDNGPGIRQEDLHKLNEHIKGTATYKEFGVALRNIHSRITLLFGAQYGLKVDSNYGQGTTVTVALPAKEKGELEKDVVQITHCR